jgi:hypothetical protein
LKEGSTTMHTTNTTTPASTENQSIGSFSLSSEDRLLVSEALKIAMQMRNEGDGHLEDTARAMILIRGAGLADSLGEKAKAVDYAEMDEQVVDYMDGVALLMERFPKGPNHH